jgi:hypothetical protein
MPTASAPDVGADTVSVLPEMAPVTASAAAPTMVVGDDSACAGLTV